MTFIQLFIVKLIDSFLQGNKSMAVQQRKPILAGILTFILNIIMFMIIKNIVTSGNILNIFAVALASGLGVFLSIYYKNKKTPDKVWEYNIICRTITESQQLADSLRCAKIQTYTKKGFQGKGYKQLIIVCLSHNKEESKIIESYLPEECNITATRVIKTQ